MLLASSYAPELLYGCFSKTFTPSGIRYLSSFSLTHIWGLGHGRWVQTAK